MIAFLGFYLQPHSQNFVENHPQKENFNAKWSEIQSSQSSNVEVDPSQQSLSSEFEVWTETVSGMKKGRVIGLAGFGRCDYGGISSDTCEMPTKLEITVQKQNKHIQNLQSTIIFL
ncbi:hypothetical protein ACH5RR_012435 [Cinchona calisaya]|uniref:Uncharacterized protein n=1 Tax=Cinchona calisaya TaxID=153742 RepID=A0ABD3A996_9GENT